METQPDLPCRGWAGLLSVFLPQAGDALEPAWREEADRRPQLAEQDHVHHTVGSRAHGPSAHASTTSGEEQQLNVHFWNVKKKVSK